MTEACFQLPLDDNFRGGVTLTGSQEDTLRSPDDGISWDPRVDGRAPGEWDSGCFGWDGIFVDFFLAIWMGLVCVFFLGVKLTQNQPGTFLVKTLGDCL